MDDRRRPWQLRDHCDRSRLARIPVVATRHEDRRHRIWVGTDNGLFRLERRPPMSTLSPAVGDHMTVRARPSAVAHLLLRAWIVSQRPRTSQSGISPASRATSRSMRSIEDVETDVLIAAEQGHAADGETAEDDAIELTRPFNPTA